METRPLEASEDARLRLRKRLVTGSATCARLLMQDGLATVCYCCVPGACAIHICVFRPPMFVKQYCYAV